jgi:trehalose 6-phosphate phosphatase
MRYALAGEGLKCLRAIAAQDALLAFDIDGTLAPIAAQPWAARIPERSLRALVRLVAHRTVAVITGRSVADAQRMLGFEPRYLVGNHGAEGTPGETASMAELREETRAWIAALTADATTWPPVPGVLLEDKGCSLALHYRHASDRDQALEAIERRVRTVEPVPRLIQGKCVLNLVPSAAPHKGDALRALLADSGHTRALYVGDDVTDDDVFRLHLPGVLSVRVAPVGDHGTDLYLGAQDEVTILLDELLAMIESGAQRPERALT